MPVYRYRCEECQHEFEELHAMDADAPDCPECDADAVKRLIVTAPAIAKGVLTHAGNGKRASKEELQDKWREETPKLRRKLRDKFGDDAVSQIPTLNMDIGDK
jgi:putative FmdB family regulatory protein